VTGVQTCALPICAFAAGPLARAARLTALYDGLETRDFSRDVLQGNEHGLRLEIVPPCGWTDLGTPARVEACLATLREDSVASRPSLFREGRAALDLAFALDESRGPARATALSA
jgi:hypothetical protein